MVPRARGGMARRGLREPGGSCDLLCPDPGGGARACICVKLNLTTHLRFVHPALCVVSR